MAPCGDIDPDEVRRIASIELGATPVDAARRDAGTTRIDVACEGSRAQISVLDPLTGKSLGRAVSLDAVAIPARARLLALAVAELVSASWVELESNPEPIVPPATVPAPASARAAARAVIRERAKAQLSPGRAPTPTLWRVGGVLGARWFAVDSDPFLSVGVRASIDPYKIVGLEVDALAEHSSSSYTLGSVTGDLLSTSASLRLRRELGRFTLHGGPGLRVGLARFAGYPTSTITATGHQVSGPWVGPIVTAGADYTTSSRLALTLGLEVGYVLLPVRGIVDGGSDVRVDSLFGAATLGAGWAF